MAKPKELNFFSFHWEDGIESYQRHFAHMQTRLRGEASPSYTRAPLVDGVPERIAEAIPQVHLIYLIRHPIERMKSEYLHRVHLGKERAGSFSEAILTNPRYLLVSRYAYQIDRYLEHFPRSQLLVMTTERLKSERVEAIQDVLRFVGADASLLPGDLDRELNRADEKLRIPRALDSVRTVWRFARPVTGRIPRRWRHGLRAKLGRQINGEATYLGHDQETRVWEELMSDLIRLREIIGPQMNLWATDVAD
jgi:sulfotransferase family protein